MQVKVIRMNETELPKYETIGSAGMDVRANIKEPITLAPGAIKLIPIGLKVEIPLGYEIQVRPRSGLALRHGLGMANSVGTIDSDYRGEIGVISINLSDKPYTIQPQERIAQIILNKVEQIEWTEVEELGTTERGAGGYGHTGK
ncbi:MAG: dUTP diphosphatase [Fusobacterium sp.]|uniref:dUTP diphosphatase n=1 Tax=Fusobacterium sp. TaxID=68766 RepID=UPI002A7509ED|nr:dUTP diphosphatase [Fusobacterium sp.]MDY3059303.1 dUTP diphosphatase [Fusobacterium sp.]